MLSDTTAKDLESRVSAVAELVADKLRDAGKTEDESFGLHWDFDQKWSNKKRSTRPLEAPADHASE